MLIAAKRADSISSELALHTYNNTEADAKLLSENTELVRQVKANTDALEEIHRHVTALTRAINLDAGTFDPPRELNGADSASGCARRTCVDQHQVTLRRTATQSARMT